MINQADTSVISLKVMKAHQNITRGYNITWFCFQLID